MIQIVYCRMNYSKLFVTILLVLFCEILYSQAHHFSISSSGPNKLNKKVIQSFGQPINSLPITKYGKVLTSGFVNPISFYGIIDFEDLNIIATPNPFVDNLKIKLPYIFNQIKIIISDFAGKNIHQSTFYNSNEILLDFSNTNIVSQLYILSIKADGRIYKAKIIRL